MQRILLFRLTLSSGVSAPAAAPPFIRRMFAAVVDDFERPTVAMTDPGWTTAKAELVPVSSAMRKSGLAIMVPTICILIFVSDDKN